MTAEDELIRRHIGIVKWVTSRMGHSDSWDDDYAAGLIGLLKAVRTWNPDGGAALTTWAVPIIRNEITDERCRRRGANYRRASALGQLYVEALSLDSPVNDEHGTTLADRLVEPSVEVDRTLNPLMADLLSVTTPPERTVLFESHEVAARDLGCRVDAAARRHYRLRKTVLQRLERKAAAA